MGSPPYKEETNNVISWIVNEAATIIRTSTITDDDPKVTTRDGKLSVASIVKLAKFVSKRIDVVPPIILQALDSAIQARKAYHKHFEQLIATSPDADIERSNHSHEHFIRALSEIFEVLGGPKWVQTSKLKEADFTPDNTAELERTHIPSTIVTHSSRQDLFEAIMKAAVLGTTKSTTPNGRLRTTIQPIYSSLRGDPGEAQGSFNVELYELSSDQSRTGKLNKYFAQLVVTKHDIEIEKSNHTHDGLRNLRGTGRSSEVHGTFIAIDILEQGTCDWRKEGDLELVAASSRSQRRDISVPASPLGVLSPPNMLRVFGGDGLQSSGS
ncbi:hypothetical protein F4819DRAFT_485550 [Hypoxylon fuscum]|nr:hypothetical protein F4819DRAFT_485550 [Hypoxylon fuscum]